jgi:hypothetical protein
VDGDQTDVEQLRKVLDRRGTVLEHEIRYSTLTPDYFLRTAPAGTVSEQTYNILTTSGRFIRPHGIVPLRATFARSIVLEKTLCFT